MVSVVIPTQNRSGLLGRAIESVQKQTFKDLEIIVVSDGSEDNTKEIVEAYAKEDSRVIFIEYYPAKGGNIARNTGIQVAKGEFVAFLDDDDEWMPEKIERQLSVMNSDPEIGLVYTGVHIIYVNEKISYSSKARETGDLKTRILLDNYIGTTSTVMIKKELLKKSGYFDVALKALQDFDLWIRICQHCKVGVVPEEMINYYNYLGNKQISAFTQKYVDSFEYINAKYADAFAGLSNEEKKQKKYNELILLSNKAMRNGDKKQARIYVKKAMKISFNKKTIAYYLLSFVSYKTTLKVRSKF